MQTQCETDALSRRVQLQRDAVTTLLRDRRVMVNWGTGVGKSRVAIEAADILLKAGALRILLLVDQTLHKNNWLNEFVEAKGDPAGRYIYESLTVECYASLPFLAGTQWDAIFADEAHHLRGENRCAILSTMKCDYFLGLTATVSCRGDGDLLIRTVTDSFGKMTTLEYDIQNAIDDHILGRPRITVHVLPLDGITDHQTVVEEWGEQTRRASLECSYADRFSFTRDKIPAATLSIDCTAGEAYEYWSAKYDYLTKKWKDARDAVNLSPGQKDTRETAWVNNRRQQAALRRKNVIGTAKTRFARWLLRQMKDRKYVCFCNDVDQACTLGGEHAIFSGRENDLERIERNSGQSAETFRKREEVVEAFNAGDIRSIFAVDMLVEGQNLRGIEAGVVVQLAGKDRKFIQELGRAMRARNPEQHIIVIDGTRDVDYLSSALSSLDPSFVAFRGYGRLSGKVSSLNDLSNGEKPQERTVVAERFTVAASREALQGTLFQESSRTHP